MQSLRCCIYYLSIFFLIILFTVVGKTQQDAASFTHLDVARNGIILDLHCDTVYRFHRLGSIKPFDGSKLQVTVQGLKDSGVKAQFFALWCPPSAGFNLIAHLLDLFDKMLENHKDFLAFAGSAEDLRKNVANRKVSAFIGIESGRAIDGKIENLDYLYKRGVRSMSLTWNESNALAEGSGDASKSRGGLTKLGERVIRRMNEIGMIVDVSHSSRETVRDILRISSDPVIATHSCCYSLRKFHRNLRDDQIESICKGGGVVGINFYSKHLVESGRADVSDVADHIDHLVEIGGIGCAAIGSDYDGMLVPASGLENVGKLENLTKELIRRGYTKEDIIGIYGYNFIRVLEQVVDK